MERLKKRRELDLTSGSLFGKILLFILPLMASNLLQTLYNAADMMVVSLSREANSVGAIGFTGPFVNMITNIFIGFSAGATVVVARHLGARDDEGVSNTVHTSIAMSLIFGVAGGAVGLACAKPILSLMGAEGNILDLAVTYTFIYFCGIPFISLTNYLISILRAKGDTKTPLIVLSLSGLVNVGLNLFFVRVCDMAVEGVALATVIANAVSAVALLVILMRDEGPCRFYLRKLRIERHSFANILHIGIPAGIQGALFSISNMMIQSSNMKVNNWYGYDPNSYQPVMDGNAATGNLEGFAYTATNAACQAAITFTSQHMGAQKYERIKRVMLNCFAITTIIAVLFSGVIYLLRAPLLALYGVVGGAAGSPEALALEIAEIRMIWILLPYLLLALMEVAGGVVRGLGRSITSTVVSLIGSCLLRVVWLTTVFEWIFAKYNDPLLAQKTVYLSYPISWALTAAIQLVCALFILHGILKRRKDAAAL
jgi:putative MATE family efflux protein